MNSNYDNDPMGIVAAGKEEIARTTVVAQEPRKNCIVCYDGDENDWVVLQ